MSERWYYVDAEVRGRVVVQVRADNRATALIQVRDGTWRDPINVELEIVGKPIVERGEATR